AATSLSTGYAVGALVGYMIDTELRDSVWSSALAPGRSAAGYLDSSEGPNVIARSEGLDEDAWQEAATFSDLGWDLSTVWALSPAPGLPYHRWAGAESGAEPHPLPEQFLLLGKPFSLDLAANFSPLPGDIVSFSASGLPSGLSVDTATGLLR